MLEIINRQLIRLEKHKKILGLLLSLGIFAWLVRTSLLGFSQLPSLTWQFDWRFLVAAVVVQSLVFLMAIKVWQSMVAQMGYSTTFLVAGLIWCASNVLRRLPLMVGHIAGRAVLYARWGANPFQAVAAGAVEMIIFPAGGGLCYLLLLPFSPYRQLAVSVVALLVFLAGSALLHPRAMNMLLRYVGARSHAASLQHVNLQIGRVVAWFAASVVIIALGGTALFFLLRWVQQVPIAVLPVAIQAWALAVALGGLLFFIPTTLGIREGILVLPLGSVVPLPLALGVALLFRVWLLVFELVPGGVAVAAGALIDKGGSGIREGLVFFRRS